MEKMKSREDDLLGALEQIEEKFHRHMNEKCELLQQMQHMKNLVSKKSLLEEKIDKLEREKLDLELRWAETVKNEAASLQELALMKSKNQVLERQLQDYKEYAEENRCEKEVSV